MSSLPAVIQGAATALISALALGIALLGLMRVRVRLGEIYPAALACGVPLLAGVCAVLIRSGQFRRGTLNAALAVSILLAVALARRILVERATRPPLASIALLALPLLIFLYFPATALLAPDLTPAGADAVLAEARRFSEGRRHGNWDAAALWAAPFRFGAHSSVALLHFCFLPSLAALIFAGVRRYSTTQAAIVSALLACTAPAALLFASRAGTQVLFWFYACAGIWLATIAWTSRQYILLIPAALSGVFAAQCDPLRGDAFGGFIFQRLPWMLIPLAALAFGWLLRRQAVAACVLVAFHLLTSFPPMTQRLTSDVLLPVVSFDGNAPNFLTQHLPGYASASYLEEFVPANGLILTDQLLPHARLPRRLAPTSLLRILDAAYNKNARPDRLLRSSIAPKPRRRFQVTTGGTIAEVRFYVDGLELTRSSDWRVRTLSNERCAPLAFDNSLVTGCDSGIEIDFGRDVIFHEFRVHGTRGKPVPIPPGLRRAAILELRRRGVTHIFLPAVSAAVADLSSNAPYWGVTEIGEVNGAVLFHLD